MCLSEQPHMGETSTRGTAANEIKNVATIAVMLFIQLYIV